MLAKFCEQMWQSHIILFRVFQLNLQTLMFCLRSSLLSPYAFFYLFQLGENKSWNGQNVGFPEPTSNSKYCFLNLYLYLILFVGFGLFKTIEMLLVNILRLDELTLECPLCDCRSERVDVSAGTRNLFTH